MSAQPSIRKVLTLAVAVAVAGTATLSVAALGFSSVAAYAAANQQPVTFSITDGNLTIAQTPAAAIALVPGTATVLPDTTVTDARASTSRTGSWTASNVASDLTAGTANITASNIAMAQTGSFAAGSGTDDNTVGGTVTVTGDSINSVYVYTPTANLTVPANSNSGSYTGTVTQTVV